MKYMIIPIAFLLGIILTIATDAARHSGVRRFWVRVPPRVPTDWAPRFRRWEHGVEVAP